MTRNPSQGGFTLIELMISMLVGLIVVGATLGLAVSLMAANNDAIRSTRLTQELRAVSDVLGTELRRARSLEDPLAVVGQGSAAQQACNAVEVTAQCLSIGYQCQPATGTGNFRLFFKDGSDLRMATSTTRVACTDPRPSGSGVVSLNSADLAVTDVQFAQSTGDSVSIQVTGRLNSDKASPPMSRTVTRVVYPRSAVVAP